MKILGDRSGGAKIRLIIPKLIVLSERKHIPPRRFGRWLLVSGSIVLSLLVVAVLYIPSIGIIEKRTSGDITFTDSAGSPLNGAIELSGAGMSSGLKPNINSISWTNIPGARVYFNAFETKSVSINLRIIGDSPKGKVILENCGSDLPRGVNISAPGVPIKYMEISTTGVSFAEAEISILYTGSELKGPDEKTLAIYRYDSAAQAWNELPTKIDAKNNILSMTVNSLSIFAVSAKGQKIEVRDIRNTSVVSDIKTYDEAKTLRKTAEKTDTLSASDISDKGEVEIDALSNKNVAVKLKINRASGGEVVLDDYGKNNPVPVPLPGKVIRFVEIGAKNISYSSATVTIRYSKAELAGADENSLVIYHWNGVSWEALLTTVDTVNNTLSATTGALSPFGVSTGYGYINAIIARKVILDEPWGTGWPPENGGTNWESGVSVSQYVYIVLISNSGFPIPGANVTGFYTAANGSTNLFPFSGTTDAYGEFNKSTSLDNQVRIGQTSNSMGPNEGTWNVTINVTYNSTTTSINRSFILGEYGCGRSGSLCHQPLGGIASKGSAMLSFPALSHDPYIEGVGWASTESMHIVYAGNPPTNTMHEGQVDANYGMGPGITQGTSCTTCHRGYDQAGYNTTLVYLDTGVVLTTKGDVHDVNGVKCKDCHQNFTYTYEQRRYEVPQCYNSTCHANTTNVPKTWVQSKNDSYSWNQRAHDTNQTIACIFCHGPYHNITKPNSTIPGDYSANGITESEHCLNNCHKNQRYHNGSVGVQCTVCHSQAAHEIRYFNSTGNYTYNITQSPSRVNVGRNYSGKCSTCHQKPYFANILNNTKNPNDNYSVVNGSYSKGSSGSKPVSDPMTHSNALNNGTKWGNYWNASTDSDSCMYCHGNVYNNVGFSFTESALGHIVQFMGNNTVNSSISSSTYWCASCHWQGYTSGGQTYNDMINSYLSDNHSAPPEITGNATYGANQSVYEYTNHSLYAKNDSACNLCHGYRYGFTTITQLMHNQSRVGGPNCADCHDTGGIVLLSHVNVTATNDTSAVHKNLNSGASASNTTAYYSNNKRCWACHGNGSEPSPNAHPTNYKTPYNCTACHLQSGSQNFNFTPNSTLLNVTQHYWNGTNISTANATSCYACHNKSEMMILANDPDNGSGAVYGGANGGNNSTSHYGKKRTDLASLDSITYCSYCHNNATNNATFYVSDLNNTMLNHSARATTPLCSDSTCHNPGRIHNSTLAKPVSNDSFCSTCHGTGGSAATNNKVQHKTLYCTECHANSTTATRAGRDIHAIKYLLQNNTFSTSNSSAVNCVTCHQTFNVDSSLANFTAFKITTPLHHSDNISNGSVWGSYWTTPQTACIYCHNDTKHNATPLGRILLWNSNYQMYGSIGTNASCSDCHYGSDSNYIQMNSTFVSAGLRTPPEITNGTNWNGTGLNYYNHSFSSYDDQTCKACHNSLLSSTANMSEFTHNVAVGIKGGANCTACHDIGGSAGAGKLVNISAMNDTNAIHKNLNSNATSPSGYPSADFRCWACHGNGSEPNAHPSNYKTPYNCTSCHIPIAGQNLNYTPNTTLLNVTQHYWNGTNISTANATSCYACHNKSEMMLGSVDPDGAGTVYGGANGGNNSTSHYGRKRTDYSIIQGTNDYCYRCHNNASTVFPFIDANNMTIANHSMNYNSTNPACSDCHAQGRLHNSTLTKPAFTLPNSTFCTSSCHGVGGTATIKNLSRHNNTLNCTQCHLNSSRSIHPARYLQQDGLNWSTTNNTAINCTNCHQTQLANFSSAPIIPNPLKHSSNLSNGSIWGTYWTTNNGSCYYCHNNTKHNSTAFGTIYNLLVDTNNTRNGTLTTTTWCANCHYNDTVNTNYLGTQWSTVPPLITVNNTVNVRWQNHSTYLTSGYKDSNCQTCHALNGSYLTTSLNYSHSLDEGITGGPDCINCHDISGSGAPGNKRIKASSMKLGVHKNLNSNATNSSSIDPINKACWACHGEGTEPAGHPERYKNPRECSNNDCHSLSQSFKAPMVYSHFKDAELNGNPGNVTSYNVSTGVLCEACHSNSLSAESVNLNASVSHYATSENLIDSINCIYCHLDRDNSIKWGNATEINKNRSSLVEMDRIINKFSARTGEFVDFGLGYRVRVTGIAALRGSAILELYKEENLVDIGLVNIGRYVYEENRIINNASSKIPVIVLNITDMFLFGDDGFIQFEGFRIKRLHNENKTTSCYLCHFKGSNEKHKYTVIDRIDKDVFYTEVLFNSSDRNEYEQEQALLILANLTPANAHFSIERPKRKTMQKGEIWKLAGNYSLTLEDVAENSDSASFLLDVGGRNFTNIVKRGEIFDYELSINYLGYTYTKVVIFRAKVSEISQNIVVLEDIVALSPNIVKINVNSTIYGYNASWLWKNNTFMIGMIPSDLHVPLLYDGSDGGAACTSCHNVGELGAHKDINKAAFSSVFSENKACWACHGEGKEPKWHPSNYKNPRKCKSCHVERGITYNATYIGDEKHGALVNCNQCHVVDTHKIIRFDVTPGIRRLSISKEEVYEGEKVRIYATAVAGYEMRIGGAEYYIDSIDKPAPMLTVDGSFDGQIEEMTAEIDTAGLKPGNHSIYVRAMEWNNKWGTISSISLIVKEKESAIVTKKSEKIPDVPGFLILILMILSQHIRKNKLLR
ncbi:MAG: hypothetical protein PHU34_08150 [Candidatus Methanoperedens sp.]|nr:hypothetical protein [Candidatus Methanoperedens sp.]